MKLLIDQAVFGRFPGFSAGVLVGSGIDNSRRSSEIELMGHSVAEHVRQEFAEYPAPSQHPAILAWRRAYKAFGVDPRDYRCSVEGLVRQVLKGREFLGINALVDLYNLISLKYVLPVGGENIGKIAGDVRLTFAEGDEQFVRLGGDENEPPEPGEVVYKDDVGVICRRWNWREAERTKLTERTTDAVIVIESLPPSPREKLEAATAELAGLIERYCGGTIQTTIVDRSNPSVSLS